MGCAFCHSTVNGLERNLSAYEILAQIYEAGKDIGERISNVVIMGSGEPLDNYDNVIDFISIVNEESGLNIGQRHITLSTCGIVPEIYDLAKLDLSINLAISLHAPNDEIRKQIMPIAKAYNMNGLIKACDIYAERTGRRVTYEYALIKDLNDSEANALELCKLLRGKLCHVNLIPVNDVAESGLFRPGKKVIESFAGILKAKGINVTVRRELGSDINAACGQLKAAYKEELL
jgi:23S rRNA (adenine2503-C2)-methyltransferase